MTLELVGKLQSCHTSLGADGMKSNVVGAALVVLNMAAAGCAGAAGTQGPAGPQGPKGDPGPPGSTTYANAAGSAANGAGSSAPAVYRPRFWIGCQALLDLLDGSSSTVMPGHDGINETKLDYTLTVYTSNDVDVSCIAAAGSAQSGSDSAFYPSVTVGASKGTCVADDDLPPFPPPPSQVGGWDFDVEQRGIVATYEDDDPGHPLNGYAHVFTQAECNANKLDDDLKWTQVTLADVFSKM